MNAFTSRRAGASCGALALLLGVGALVPLSAQAADGPSALSGLGTAVSGTVTQATTTLAPVTTAATTATGSTSSTGSSGSVLGLVDLNTGTAATPSSGLVTVPGVVSVGLDGLLGGTGTGTGTGTGGAGVTVGSDGAGGSLVDIDLGGTGGTTGTGGGGGGTTTNTTTGGSTTTVNNGSSTTTGGSTTDSSTTGSTAPTPAPTTAPAVSKVLGFSAAPSISTVYPVKDGYRDDVVFRVAARLASAAKGGLSGSAVLTRGSKAITQWSITQPTQDLRWNGLDHGKLVAGTYVLTATLKDATGATHTTTTKVVASPKRLIASTQKVNALAVSGKHAMAAAARAGLGKGVVTLRLTTVAPKVTGKQFLIFQKGTKQLRVQIKQGTHTTKAVRVPKELTSYTLKHTWKKGQVKLKSIRYTYSYQSLR